jgi:hypothetical protein
MAVLAYTLLWVSVAVAVLCLGHVWLQGLAHALGARDRSPAGRSHKLFWVTMMLVFGWLGAITYWLVACPRSA